MFGETFIQTSLSDLERGAESRITRDRVDR